MLRRAAARLKAQLPWDCLPPPPFHDAAMPLFDFACAACGKVSEILVRSADEKPACPACGSTRLERELPTFRAHTAPAAPHVHTGSCGCGKPRGGCGAN